MPLTTRTCVRSVILNPHPSSIVLPWCRRGDDMFLHQYLLHSFLRNSSVCVAGRDPAPAWRGSNVKFVFPGLGSCAAAAGVCGVVFRICVLSLFCWMRVRLRSSVKHWHFRGGLWTCPSLLSLGRLWSLAPSPHCLLGGPVTGRSLLLPFASFGSVRILHPPPALRGCMLLHYLFPTGFQYRRSL